MDKALQKDLETLWNEVMGSLSTENAAFVLFLVTAAPTFLKILEIETSSFWCKLYFDPIKLT